MAVRIEPNAEPIPGYRVGPPLARRPTLVPMSRVLALLAVFGLALAGCGESGSPPINPGLQLRGCRGQSCRVGIEQCHGVAAIGEFCCGRGSDSRGSPGDECYRLGHRALLIDYERKTG